MAAPTLRKHDRVFVRNGFKHYRPLYSRSELRAGLVVVGVLVGIVGWVVQQGRSDASLITQSLSLTNRARAAVDRGPIPLNLAAPGWEEAGLSLFGADNLYEKINGRADYYRAFGCDRMYFVALVGPDGQDEQKTVDLEIYHLASAAGALGAYAGERPPSARTKVTASGVGHQTSNALFFTHGLYYVRAIGPEISPATEEALVHARRTLTEGLPSGGLPWGHRLFSGHLSLDPGAVEYAQENAYSFDFASHVYSATLEDGETQLFVAYAGEAAAAETLAGRFVEGFLEYGTRVEGPGPSRWVSDRYLDTLATALALGPWTAGVKGAANREVGEAALAKLTAALEEVGPTLSGEALAERSPKGIPSGPEDESARDPGEGTGAGQALGDDEG